VSYQTKTSEIFFLEGRHPNASGKTIGEIYGYTDQQIETDHTFIQWLFPTDEPSRSVPNSPVLRPNDVVLIKESEVAQANLKKSADWYLGFLIRNNHWVKRYDHNHLRITRVIKSLRLLVNDEVADSFKIELYNILAADRIVIPQGTRQFWDEA